MNDDNSIELVFQNKDKVFSLDIKERWQIIAAILIRFFVKRLKYPNFATLMVFDSFNQ